MLSGYLISLFFRRQTSLALAPSPSWVKKSFSNLRFYLEISASRPCHASLRARRVGEVTFEVARLGESLSRRHKDTEKSSCSERRRPRRHQQISAMTVRQDRSTQCGKIRCQFLRLPDSIASLPIRIPAWISRSLGSLRWGCSMQGGDFRGHLRNQFLTSTSAWENLFLRPATRSGKSASDIWTYCHKSIYPEVQ